MLLVTGVGRSGTHYTAALLREMGLDVGHETVGRDGAASWKHAVSGTFVVKKRFRRARVTEIDSKIFETVLHQVRDPLKVVASMQTFGEATWSYMAQHTSVSMEQPVLARAMLGYIEWNRLVEARAEWRFRIEALPEVFDEFCRRAGVEPMAMPEVPREKRDARGARYTPVTWEDLSAADASLASELEAMARAYGYDAAHSDG
jgi:hypothetical protein